MEKQLRVFLLLDVVITEYMLNHMRFVDWRVLDEHLRGLAKHGRALKDVKLVRLKGFHAF